MGGVRWPFGRAAVRGARPLRTKKEWVSFHSTAPLSITTDSRVIIFSTATWGALDADDPVVIRFVGSVTVWSEDDDAADAAVLYRVGFQFSRAPRSANPRMLSDGYDNDLKWLAGGVLINSGAVADQIHAYGRVGYHLFDFNPRFKVRDNLEEIALGGEVDQQSGTISPVLVSFQGRALISLGY